jgi:hypothetical protein
LVCYTWKILRRLFVCGGHGALLNESWIRNINLEAPFSEVYLAQFIDMWILINNVHSIIWKLMANGQYSTALAHKLQFFGLVQSEMNTNMWKAWASTKAKHHACLAIQNRLWTANCLEKRGWPIVGFALFASKLRNRLTTYSSIVFLPFGFVI